MVVIVVCRETPQLHAIFKLSIRHDRLEVGLLIPQAEKKERAGTCLFKFSTHL